MIDEQLFGKELPTNMNSYYIINVQVYQNPTKGLIFLDYLDTDIH